MTENNDKNSLNTISMEELFDNVYPPKKIIIENLLYSGTYLFVGAPKIGKSFMMAQIGYCVSTGAEFLGFNPYKGTVLYLALEDNYARLQKRLSKMFDMQTSETFYFATQSQALSNGLDKQLEDFISKHSDTRLIIIDTLQKIREVGGEKYSYGTDYDVVTKLKQFSDKNNICIILVHHTRKMDSNDSFDLISGTNGLLGAADGAFVMQKVKRTEDTATLDIVGRDQPDQKLYLSFDRNTCVWKFVKSDCELFKETKDNFLKKIAEFTDINKQWCGTATELLEILNIPEITAANAMTRRLNVNVSRLLSEYKVYYESSRNHNGRLIKLTRVNDDLHTL